MISSDLKKNGGYMAHLTASATMAITAKAKLLKAAGEEVYSLSAGEPDFDTPGHIKEAAIAALNAGYTKYTPATGLPELKEAITKKFQTENGITTQPGNVVVAPGAKFSVFTGIASVCGPGDEVILVAPYWVSYPEMVKATGATCKVIYGKSDKGYELDPAELKEAITEKTKLLILNTPSNPAGTVYKKDTLEKIADIVLSKGIMVLSDEIYEKLVYDETMPHISIASLSREIALRTITVNGLSKAYSMTGWRLGYLTAAGEFIKKISALQSHTTSNPTTFVQYGAIAALTGDQTPVENMRRAFAKRREIIYKLMSGLPEVKCIYPYGAFYLFCDISKITTDSMKFAESLLERKKVAVIPGEPFGMPGHIRLSYACSEDVIYKAHQRIKEFIDEFDKRIF